MSELHSSASRNEHFLEHLHNCYAGYVGFCSEPKGPRQKGRSRVTLLPFGLFSKYVLKGFYCV